MTTPDVLPEDMASLRAVTLALIAERDELLQRYAYADHRAAAQGGCAARLVPAPGACSTRRRTTSSASPSTNPIPPDRASPDRPPTDTASADPVSRPSRAHAAFAR